MSSTTAPDGVTCADCGTTNPFEQVYCAECGRQLRTPWLVGGL